MNPKTIICALQILWASPQCNLFEGAAESECHDYIEASELMQRILTHNSYLVIILMKIDS